MLDPESVVNKLGAIDRSMYLKLDERDVDMFKLLKQGEGSRFINEFVARCLEKNGIDEREAKRIKFTILNQIGGEYVRQKIGRKDDTSAYLQIIFQEFSDYGVRFSPVTTEAPGSDFENAILRYFKSAPGADSLEAYEHFRKYPVGEEQYSFQQFSKVLEEMKDKGYMKRKAIEVPLEYRLMVRNIAAMQNLRKKWASSQV
jgi:hypothetical protein